MRRLLPVLNSALRRLGRDVDPRRSASDVTILAPAEEQEVTPPAFLPGQLDKVMAVHPARFSRSSVLERATQRSVTHAPVIRYTFHDCVVHPAGFDVWSGSYRNRPMSSVAYPRDGIGRLPKANYCMSTNSLKWFGDWLMDSCTAAHLATADEALFMDIRRDWPHASQYAQAFGLEPEPIEGKMFRVARLCMHQDHGMGSMKRARLREMRQTLASRFAPGARTFPSRPVYLRRGLAGVSRPIVNEAELIEGLTRRGFDVFDLEGADLKDIQERFRTTELVVSLEGSHLNHLYFAMKPGASILALIPSDRFIVVQLGFARSVGMRFGFVVVDPVTGGYRVNLPDVLKTVDLLQR